MIAAFKALSGTQKVLWSLGIILAPLFIVSAVSPTPGMQKTARVYQTAEQLPAASVNTPTEVAAEPQVLPSETKTVTETMPLPHTSITQEDATLEAGKVVTAVQGANGEKTLTYTVIYTDGQETSRLQTEERITKQPITEVKKVGIKPKAAAAVIPKTPAPHCESNRKSCAADPGSNRIACATTSTSQLNVFGNVHILGIGINVDTGARQQACEF